MPLPISMQKPGVTAQWAIGRRGEGHLDVHPVRVFDVGPGFDDMGRRGLVAQVVRQVTARPEQGGHKYNDIRQILVQNLDLRPVREDLEGFEPVIGLDVDENGNIIPLQALWDEVSSAGKQFLMTGGSSLEEQAAAILAESEKDADPTKELV